MITRLLAALLLLTCGLAPAGTEIDLEAFGTSLGGWKQKGKTSIVDYSLSGSRYRTYKPEITPTPDGGILVTIRIDHIRRWLASDDHAVLEVTFASDGAVTSARSSLALQGRTVTSDLIRMGADAGTRVSTVDRAVKIGADLAANLTSKILREKIVEAGRVSFPSTLRHNYNLLYQAVRVLPAAVVIDPPGNSKVPDRPDPADPALPAIPADSTRPAASAESAESAGRRKDPAPADSADPDPAPELEIKPYGKPPKS